MQYNPQRIKTLIHYERLSEINPQFKMSDEQKEYLAGYRAQKAAEDELKKDELVSEPFQLIRVTEDGTENVDTSALLETPKKRTRRKKKVEETPNESE